MRARDCLTPAPPDRRPRSDGYTRAAADIAPWTDDEAARWWRTRRHGLMATRHAEQAAAASGSAKRVAPDLGSIGPDPRAPVKLAWIA